MEWIDKTSNSYWEAGGWIEDTTWNTDHWESPTGNVWIVPKDTWAVGFRPTHLRINQSQGAGASITVLLVDTNDDTIAQALNYTPYDDIEITWGDYDIQYLRTSDLSEVPEYLEVDTIEFYAEEPAEPEVGKVNTVLVASIAGISSTASDDIHAVSTILWPHGSPPEPLVTYTGTLYPVADTWLNSEVEKGWLSFYYANPLLNVGYEYSGAFFGPSYLFMQFSPVSMDSLVDTTFSLTIQTWDFYSGYHDPGEFALTLCDRFRNPITSTKYVELERYTSSPQTYTTHVVTWTDVNISKADLTAINLKIELVDYDDAEEEWHELRYMWLEVTGSGVALQELAGEWVDYTDVKYWEGGQLNLDAPPWPTIDEENFPDIPPWAEVYGQSTWSGTWWHISNLGPYLYGKSPKQWYFDPFIYKNYQWSTVPGVGVGTSYFTTDGYEPFTFKRPTKLRITISEGAISKLAITGSQYYRTGSIYGSLIGPSETYADNSINWGPGVYEVDLNCYFDLIDRIFMKPATSPGYAKITKIEFYMPTEGEHLPLSSVMSFSSSDSTVWTVEGVEENPPYPHTSEWWGDYKGATDFIADPDNWGWRKADKSTIGTVYRLGDTDNALPTILEPKNQMVDIEFHLSVGNPDTGVNPYIYITPISHTIDYYTYVYSYHSLGDEEVCWQPSGDPGEFHSFVWEDVDTTQSGYGLSNAQLAPRHTSDPYIEYYMWYPLWNPHSVQLRVVGGEYDNYLWEIRGAYIKSTQPRWRNVTNESYWQSNDYITYTDSEWHISSGDTGRLSVNGIWYKGVLFKKIRITVKSGGLSFVKIYDTVNRLLNEQWQPHAAGTYELDFTNATVDLGYIDFIADYDTVISYIAFYYQDNQYICKPYFTSSLGSWATYGYADAAECVVDDNNATYISSAESLSAVKLLTDETKLYTNGIGGVDYDVTLHIRAAASGTNTLYVKLNAGGTQFEDEKTIEITGDTPTEYTITWEQARIYSGQATGFLIEYRVPDAAFPYVTIYNTYMSFINTWEDWGVYDLEASAELPHGVTVASGSVSPESTTYAYDEGLILTATASGECSFVEWTGDTDNLVDPYSATTTLINPLHLDTTVEARFDCPGLVYKTLELVPTSDCYLRQYKPTSAYAFYSGQTSNTFGESSIYRYWSMLHFDNVNLPSDAIIDDAYFKLTSTSTFSNTGSLKVGLNVEDAESPSLPTSSVDFLARTMVSGAYDYGDYEPAWTTNTQYTVTMGHTVSGAEHNFFKDQIQTLVNTYSGTSDINVYMGYTLTGSAYYRGWYGAAYSTTTSRRPVLVIKYYSTYNE